MNVLDGKFAWMVKIGEKGQFVIPKEARDVFGFQPGEEILVLGDVNRGIAILPREMQKEYIARLFEQMEA
jgi:AbrB family looped-hinge helix DNA binding protein